MGKSVEFHFQEGFTGHVVTLAVDGKVQLSSETQTRYQIGLARIETFELTSGQTVTIEVPDLKIGETYEVGESDQWVSVNRIDHSLVIRPEIQSPGYL